jgi:hypothetical protein
LGVYVVVVARLVQRTENQATRNGPALAPSRYRFDLCGATIKVSSHLDCRAAGPSPTDRPFGSARRRHSMMTIRSLLL